MSTEANCLEAGRRPSPCYLDGGEVSGSGDGKLGDGDVCGIRWVSFPLGSGEHVLQGTTLEEGLCCSAGGGDVSMGDGELQLGGAAGKAKGLPCFVDGSKGPGVEFSAVSNEKVGCMLMNSSPPPSSKLQVDSNKLAGSCSSCPHTDKSILGAPNSCPLGAQRNAHTGFHPSLQQAAPPLCISESGGAWRRPRIVALPLLAEIGEFSTDGRTTLLDEEEVIATSRRFAGALVGRLFGRRIPFGVLSGELHRRWASFGSFKIVTLSSDCFFCLFNSMEACDAVLLGGPWVIFGQVLGIDHWTPTFSPCSSVRFCTLT